MKRLLVALCLLMLVFMLTCCTGFAENGDDEAVPEEETKAEEAEEPEETKTITISMVGDMLFYGTVDSYMKKYGDAYVLEGYGPLIKKSDIVLGNLETPMSYSLWRKNNIPSEAGRKC